MMVGRIGCVLGLIVAAGVGGVARGQSFNVDLDTTGGSAGSGVPSSSYGGGAGQPGVWNSVRASMPQTVSLVGLNGAATTATFTRAFNGQFVNLNNANSTSGNFESLVDDIVTTGASLDSMTFSFNNLQAGTYVVYTYAMNAEFPSQQTLVTVTNSFGQLQQVCGGAPLDGNRAIPGKVYSAHGVTVPAGGTITIGLQSSFSQPVSVGGFQVKRLPDGQRNRIYVSAIADGDGGSWADGMADLQDALEASRRISGSICEVWVRSGTYRPTTGTDRNASFVIPSSLALYGGFGGTETTLAERTLPEFFITNMSGSIGTASTSDNSYHVLRMSSAGGATIVDGFTISQGTANGSNDDANGGGALLINSSPTFRNTKFISNRASIKGGGVSIQGGTPRFADCLFFDNSATNGTGGGVALGGGASATVRFANCQFLSNDALGSGGGFYTLAQPAEFVNCVFNANAALSSFAESHGGAIYAALSGANVTLRHCTVVNNTAGVSAGGLAVSTSGSITASNTILWANSDNSGLGLEAQQANTVAGSGSLNLPWVWIQGSDPNPQFVTLNGADGVPGNFDDNLRLLPSSPCVDSGNNGFLATDWLDLDANGNSSELLPVDFDGKARVVDYPGVGGGAVVDFGAFELQPPPCTGDINGDGTIDSDDLGLLLGAFGCVSGCGAADLTGDGGVDSDDLGVLLGSFGQDCP